MPYKNKEERNARWRERYAADPEFRARLGQQQKEWRAKNPEKVAAMLASERHRKGHRERCERWIANNREAYLLSQRRGQETRRARKLAAFVEVVDAKTVYEMHGGRCGICGLFIEGDFHVDHIHPLSKGGLHCYANSQPAHPICNIRKGAKLV
jgi:5-methylcytosine-specific restriction endonuclease McrA